MIIQASSGKKYQLVAGLEVHAQINTNAKLFSQSKNQFACNQNENVSFFDIAIPGTLPVINKEVLYKAIVTGIAINGKINNISRFDRKHYFYPDLPSGYQITQFYQPIVENGFIEISQEKKIRINRIHLEQDAGKLIHDRSNTSSFVDYNRAGIPLMEIVTEPDFRTIEEITLYLKKLQMILRSVKSCLADLEKGTFRCDANVSVMEIGAEKFGTRCEIKNLNSFKFIADAITYEANRQVEILESREKISQETRLFNTNTGKTETMREKADAIDYYYFPDPNLLPISISNEEIEIIKNSIPELPDAKEKRYKSLAISDQEIAMLCADPIYSDYFDEINKVHDTKTCLTWMFSELIGKLKQLNIQFSECKISPKKLIELMNLIKNNTISGKIAKDILDEMLKSDKSAEEIVTEKGLKQLDDLGEIKKIIEDIITKNPQQVEQFKAGNERLFAFFVGQAMKVTSGKANPEIVNKILKELL